MAVSTIKGGIERFVLENSQNYTHFTGYGIYDHKTGYVRIYVAVRENSARNTSILATVPARFRPSSTAHLVGNVSAGSGEYSFPIIVQTDGNIRHQSNSTTIDGMAVGEYKI